MFCFVTNKSICPNINKSTVDILLSENPQQDDQEVGLVYTFLNFFYFLTLFQCYRISWVRNIFEFFFTLFVFAPGQDQHNTDSFHRNYVKQSKKISPLEHFLVVSQSYVSRTPRELLINQRHIQLGYDLNEACCSKSLQHLKNKYNILSNNKVSGVMQDHL